MKNLFNNKSQVIQTRPIELSINNENFPDNTEVNSEVLNEIIGKLGQNVHYPPGSQEWIDGIYSYNKNYNKTLPVADSIVNKLVKSYFNMTPIQNGKKSKRVEIRFRRLSLNRLLVSSAGVKHGNDSITLTVYIYNKNRKFIFYKLKDIYNSFGTSTTDVTKEKRQFDSSKFIANKKISKTTLSSIESDATKKRPKSLKSYIRKSILRTKRNNNMMYKPMLKNTITNKAIFQSMFESIASKPTLNSKRFDTRRFKSGGRDMISYLNGASALKENNISNFNKVTKNNLSRFISRIRNTNQGLSLKNKYKTLISKYYSLVSNFNFSTTGKLHSYYINFTSIANQLLTNNNYSTSNYYGILNGKYSNIPSYSTLALKKSTVQFKSKSFRLVNRISKTRKVKNLMFKLRNIYKLFGFNNTYDYQENGTLSLNSALALREDGTSSLTNNLYKILNKSLSSKAKKKVNFVFAKATRIIKKARRHKKFLFKTLNWDNQTFINYEEKYYYRYLKKALRKELMYLYYVKMLSINNNKFKNWFLLGLKKVISKIYNKKVIFNFVNLKYLHLNSDIFTETIATKLRNRQNRLLRVLKKALHLVKLPSSNNMISSSVHKEKTYKTLLNKYKNLAPWRVSNINSDGAMSLTNNFSFDGVFMDLVGASSTVSGKNIQKLGAQTTNVLNSINYKAVFGVRLEAAGRLSRRLTASRSVFKLKYKGSLRNIDSSYKGLSSVILKGHTKSNIQYTKINSKTRNGSFGLKGWVSGY
jgi:hypothetical protein